uniref:Death effector domain-containing 1 n=1 Tax=Amphilophus citrinellus TaxID=61819 RepID=A0A3Q0SCL6_AMPCI
MALVHHQGYPLRDSLYWDETECLNYYGMLSLHEVFEVVGSQLTETDIEVLSFLLDETCVVPSPQLLKLERRGYLSDGNLEPLLQLLRVLTRHDLLPLVSHKKRRTGEDFEISLLMPCDPELTHPVCFLSGIYPPVAGPSTRRRRKKRGNGWSRRSKKTSRQGQPLPPPPAPHKVSCGKCSSCILKMLCLLLYLHPADHFSFFIQTNIRLRVRAEYLEHESALRSGVSSDKRQPLERQFELFSQANSLLRARDLGSIVCDIKFTELANLEAFWSDYLSGALLEALKGVFITDSLRNAAGSEGVRLLISVDQDDYEEGRRLLRAKKIMVGHPETH